MDKVLIDPSSFKFSRFSIFRTSPTKWHRSRPLLYSVAHRQLQWIQLVGGILTLLYLILWDDFRALAAQKSLSLSIAFLLSMSLTTVFVGIVLGWKNIPTNYISLMLIVRGIGHLWILSFYSPLEMTSVTPPTITWMKSSERILFAITGAITVSLFIAFRSKLAIGHTGVGNIVGNTLGTILSATVHFLSIVVVIQGRSQDLTSSPPPPPQYYFRLKLIWAFVTTVLAFCNMTFLLRTLLMALNQRNGFGQVIKKTLLETLIWAMSAVIVLAFVAGTQPQLTFDSALNLVQDLLTSFVGLEYYEYISKLIMTFDLY